MAKKEETPSISNINNNTNNVNVNVKVENPKKRRSKKDKKPNWIVKAIVIGLIGLAISILGYLIMGGEGAGKPAHVISGQQIQPNK